MVARTKLYNGLLKAIGMLPVSQRLRARCALMRRTASSFEPEWHRLAQIGPNQGTALDIGANRGLYAFELAKLYDRVIAFEPNVEITQELSSFRSSKISIIHSGLSDTCGRSELHVPVGKNGVLYDGWASLNTSNLPNCETTNGIAIPITTLDSLGIADVRFIKIDVEGHEVEVVRGGFDTLRRDRPTILAEVRPANLQAFSQVMHEVGLVQHTGSGAAGTDMYLFSADPH